MQHDYRFEGRDGKTVVFDRFEFQSPLGILGRIVDQLFLAGYMRGFIVKRNAWLKLTAESEERQKYL